MFSWFQRKEAADERKENNAEKQKLVSQVRSYTNPTNHTKPATNTIDQLAGGVKNFVNGGEYNSIPGHDTNARNNGHNPRRSR